MKTIEIIVTPQGKTSVQTLGFTGPSCQEASRFIEEALGQKITDLRTSEWFQSGEISQQQSQQA
jgi:hypothetical protein